MKERKKLISSPEGTGEVTLRGKYTVKVEYHLRCYQDLTEIHTGGGHVQEISGLLDIRGTITVIKGQSSLSPGELYTLYLDDKRELDFKATPYRREDRYSIVGQGNFRRS